MDNRLPARLGTWRIETKVIEEVTETDHLPDTGDRERSAILTLSLPEQGLYDENKGDIPVIWSKAPESMTHGSLEGVADAFRAVVKLPVRAKEDAVASVSNRDISRRSASTSSLLSSPISVVEEEVSSVGVVVSTVEVWWARGLNPPLVRPPRPWVERPWSFQQVSWVCRDLLQWSHNNLSLSSKVAFAVLSLFRNLKLLLGVR